MSKDTKVTLEWFGATTFRLRACGLTVFLDAWFKRPTLQEDYLSVDDIHEADYIFISHAHFDHLPGADIIAKRTGAIVIGNCEAINILRKAGVPNAQLMAVQGGERVPLFSQDIRNKADEGKIELRPTPPGAPALPHPRYAAISVDIWPSLHCLMPEEHPEYLDSGTVYTGAAHPYVCTFDVNYGMKHGLLKIDQILPEDKQNDGILSFVDYIKDRETNLFSDHDGGQLMYNIHISEGNTILWNAHLGGYEGIIRDLVPKPRLAIIGIAGRANHNGRPFDGSAAQFATKLVNWLDQPSQVIWCLHDKSVIPPYYVDTRAATDAVESMTESRVLEMKHNQIAYLTL